MSNQPSTEFEPVDTGTQSIHPALQDAFRALDEHAIPWVLLRGLRELGRPSGDVDLLVEASPRLDAALVAAGFTRLAARGHGSHRFYIAYDARDDRWVKLDVVTDVAFGRYQQFEAALAPALLARRERAGSVTVLHPDDGFWHLLLHHLLSHGEVPERRRGDVQALALEVVEGGPLEELVRAIEPRVAVGLRAAAARGEWAAVAALGRGLRREWYRRDGLGVASRSARRRLERHVLRVTPPGMTVAILGPDGAGKTTLAQALASSTALPASYLYLGVWREPRFERQLRRVFGARLALRLVTLVAKALVIRRQRRLGRLVLLDRCTVDVDLPVDLDVKGRISAMLVRRTNPQPDLIILLDAPVELMYERKREQGVAELQLRRDGYHAMRERLPQMVIVDASMPRDDVRREATRLVWQAWSHAAGAARNQALTTDGVG